MKLLVKANVYVEVQPSDAGTSDLETALFGAVSWISDIARGVATTPGQPPGPPWSVDYDVGKIKVEEAAANTPAVPPPVTIVGNPGS